MAEGWTTCYRPLTHAERWKLEQDAKSAEQILQDVENALALLPAEDKEQKQKETQAP